MQEVYAEISMGAGSRSCVRSKVKRVDDVRPS